MMKAALQGCKTRRRKSPPPPIDSAFPLTIYKTAILSHL
jgi:hypothetical protein